MKKLVYILLFAALACWAGYRIHAIYSESLREVFNAARMEARPVATMIAREETGILREPLFVKNNRAFVSGERVGKFAAGQRVGAGSIISVSGGVDLDTGMHLIRTQGAADGDQFAEQKYTGFFVPIHAVSNGIVMVALDGAATEREVAIAGQDSENVVIRRGLNDGDVVVLSRVGSGDKITAGR